VGIENTNGSLFQNALNVNDMRIEHWIRISSERKKAKMLELRAYYDSLICS